MTDDQEKRLSSLESADQLILQELKYLRHDVESLRAEVKDISSELKFEKMSKRFVPLDRFKTMEKLVYGLVGYVLLAVADKVKDLL